MAFSIIQKPVDSTDDVPVLTNWTPMVGYMMYQSDISSYFFYRIVCTVQQVDNSGSVLKTLGVLKQRRNGYGPDNDSGTQRARAFFDLASLVNSQLVDTVYDQNDAGIPFRTIHKVGQNITKIFSYNGDTSQGFVQIISILMTGSEWYSTDATEMPSSQGSTVTNTRIWLGASLPLMTARDDDADFIQGTAFSNYRMIGGSQAKFLSDIEAQIDYNLSATSEVYRNYVLEDDYGTLAFLNDYDNFACDADRMRITYTNVDGSTASYYIDNNTTNGGMPPDDASIEDTNRLLYVGVFPGNLNDCIQLPAATTWGGATTNGIARPNQQGDWIYYKVEFFTLSVSIINVPYFFIKDTGNCKGYKIRRLAWRNSLGCWDYFNFKMKSSQKVDVTRNNYSTVLGTFNKSRWRYDNTQRGSKTRQTTAILKETLNTGWISEADGRLMEKLIVSTNVQIVENIHTTYTESVMVTDTSFIRKTIANDKFIQYTINIEYANPINTNS